MASTAEVCLLRSCRRPGCRHVGVSAAAASGGDLAYLSSTSLSGPARGLVTSEAPVQVRCPEAAADVERPTVGRCAKPESVPVLDPPVHGEKVVAGRPLSTPCSVYASAVEASTIGARMIVSSEVSPEEARSPSASKCICRAGSWHFTARVRPRQGLPPSSSLDQADDVPVEVGGLTTARSSSDGRKSLVAVEDLVHQGGVALEFSEGSASAHFHEEIGRNAQCFRQPLQQSKARPLALSSPQDP